jgi:hypothetical protein
MVPVAKGKNLLRTISRLTVIKLRIPRTVSRRVFLGCRSNQLAEEFPFSTISPS